MKRVLRNTNNRSLYRNKRGKYLDREYLEDYEQKEKAQYEKLLKDIQEDKFDFTKDRYPPDERFVQLQKPVALATAGSSRINDICAQIPFSGSLILMLEPLQMSLFEEMYFPVSKIPEIIDFNRWRSYSLLKSNVNVPCHIPSAVSPQLGHCKTKANRNQNTFTITVPSQT